MSDPTARAWKSGITAPPVSGYYNATVPWFKYSGDPLSVCTVCGTQHQPRRYWLGSLFALGIFIITIMSNQVDRHTGVSPEWSRSMDDIQHRAEDGRGLYSKDATVIHLDIYRLIEVIRSIEAGLTPKNEPGVFAVSLLLISFAFIFISPFFKRPCAKCGHRRAVPVDSPIGKKLVAETPP